MTARMKIEKYLSGLKTGATVYEVMKATDLNKKTAKNNLARFDDKGIRMCRVTKKPLTAYTLSA
jgi:hypothetical protein